jgi:GT2 family glycosyltransferase
VVVVTVDQCTVCAVIVAVVVTYSAEPNALDDCLRALRVGGGLDHVVLVDTGGNASPKDADVELVRSENRGYGAAANVGFSAARRLGASQIALLNDDVFVHPGWLEPLRRELSGSVGAAQPKLLLAGVEPAIVNSLGVAIDAYGAGVDIGDGELDEPGGEASELAIFTGGAVLFRDDFLVAAGGFDERYVMYYEDIDLSLRGTQLGWTYRLVPQSVVEHERGSSTSQDPGRTRYLQERNRLWAAFRFSRPATVVRAVWLSIRRLRHQPRGVHLRALTAGLGGAPRRIAERLQHRSR